MAAMAMLSAVVSSPCLDADAASRRPRSPAGHLLNDKLRHFAPGASVPFANVDRRTTGSRNSPGHARWWMLLLLCVSASAPGRGAPVRDGRLKIDVVSGRMTLAMTGYPQVFLHGEIDADAPQRFQALMKSGRIAAGSDVYLNAPGGDPYAGMALGRMFRAAGMATHLGTPRQPKHASVAAKTAVCVDACVYAWLGGLYRWAPSGRDRIGFSTPPASVPPSLNVYLKDMGIDAATLAAATTPPDSGPAWMTADQMTADGLANNGKLPLTATAQLSAPMPTLELRQVGRQGTHRVTIQCRPGQTTLTAFDELGAERARQVASRVARSYFQLGDTPMLDQARDGAVVEGNALVIRRAYPPADLVDLVSAWSLGAWVDGRSSAFRDGFSMPVHLVHKQLSDYFYACWRAAPWPPRQKKAG